MVNILYSCVKNPTEIKSPSLWRLQRQRRQQLQLRSFKIQDLRKAKEKLRFWWCWFCPCRYIIRPDPLAHMPEDSQVGPAHSTRNQQDFGAETRDETHLWAAVVSLTSEGVLRDLMQPPRMHEECLLIIILNKPCWLTWKLLLLSVCRSGVRLAAMLPCSLVCGASHLPPSFRTNGLWEHKLIPGRSRPPRSLLEKAVEVFPPMSFAPRLSHFSNSAASRWTVQMEKSVTLRVRKEVQIWLLSINIICHLSGMFLACLHRFRYFDHMHFCAHSAVEASFRAI